MKRPLLIGAGGLAVILLALLAVSRDHDGTKSPPTTPAAPPVPAKDLAINSSGEHEPTAAPAPSFDVVRVNPQGETVIAGRAAPNAEVKVLDGGTVIGQATADARGEWVLVPDKKLPPGNRTLSLSERIPGKDEALKSNGDVLLAVPEPNRDVAGRPAEANAAALALLVPRAGAEAVRPLQVPNSGLSEANPAPPGARQRLALDVIEYDAAGRLSLAGRAEPRAALNLYLGNKLVAQVQAGSDGVWSAKPAGDVAPGLYQLRIDQVQANGKVVARLALPFQRAEPIELAKGEGFTVQPGNSLWRIARRSYGEGTKFAVIYTANRDQIANPDLIYAGQVFKLPSGN